MRPRTAIVCSIADQGVAALTNIAVLVVAARQSTAAGFAVFSLVYMVFTVLLGLSVAYVGQALVLEKGEPRAVAGACRSAVWFTATASAALGVPAAAVLWVLGGDTTAGLAALGLVLPVVLTQDTARYAFSTLRLPQHALAADMVRLAAVVPALAAQPHDASAARLIGVWGLSALPALGLALGLLWRRVRGTDRDLRRYLRRGHLGRRFAVEFGVGNAGTQLAVIGLGLLANPLAVGALRGATTLYGPMNVLFNAATGFGPPLLNRGSPRSASRAAFAAGSVLAVLAAAWTVALMLLPATYGEKLLGDTWAAASQLLPATGSQYAAMALGTCGLLTLRVLRPRTTLPIQLVFSLLSVGFMLGGYVLGGVLGAAWGLALGSAAKGAASWLRVLRVLRTPDREGGPRHGAVSAAGSGGPGGTS
ncbi:hypothetical protein [Streptomyces iconiensis]|uniref:Membrane protein involved in the export of O-antigen and teichoic acid n=1 Tax=Streptomyces iconiensis TaxID=1384038 RepID=A0ABT6ZWN2_9ACTN|nr:hypothetical protein [Streptomyces iconiensis]MDJ1133486.1 hypothetical protein [Streptomyces iconiensis]